MFIARTLRKLIRRPVGLAQQAGFTIVELMIATLVFSVILTVITVGVIHFTTAYYRGVNASTTQDVARSISDQISQAIQFSGAQPSITTAGFPANTGVVCVGNQEFYFKLGPVVNDPAVDVALHSWNIPYNVCYNNPNPGPNYYKAAATGYSSGKELLQKHMRLTALNVNDIDGGVSNTFSVTVGLAYGDDDLLCAPDSVAHSCDSSAPNLTDYTLPDLQCKSASGSQFCSVVMLNTNTQARLNFGG